MKPKHLKAELLAAGAKPQEAADLVKLAAELGQLPQPMPAVLPPLSIPARRRRWIWPILAVSLSLSLAVGMVIVALAQTANPASNLYGVKRLSEKLAVTVQPDYQSVVMMRRAQEVKQLVGQHRPSPMILATLADYNSAVATYKINNYSAFEYCHNNLQTAADQSTGEVHQAITSTLASIKIN